MQLPWKNPTFFFLELEQIKAKVHMEKQTKKKNQENLVKEKNTWKWHNQILKYKTTVTKI